MIRSRFARALAPALLVAAALAACGGGDDTADSPAGTDASGGAALTIPPEFLPAIRPVEVSGEPLPSLDGAEPDADPAVGMPVPVLVGEDYAGNPVRIDPAEDGPTMVVFLAHWCPHCNAEVPRLTGLRDAGRLPSELNIVAVATGSDPRRPNFPPGDWLDEMDWTWPAMADDIDLTEGAWVAAAAYGIDGYPFLALVDADGNLAARWSDESEPDEIVARIEQYLGL
jgi:cytochrome c biogenesis protein CcmG/thiol:disulfide interchange protein DsbE